MHRGAFTIIFCPTPGRSALTSTPHLAQLIPGAKAAQLHDLRRVDGARTHDHLAIDRQLSCTLQSTSVQTLLRP